MTTGSVDPTCETCRHYLPRRDALVGMCRRFPPTPMPGGQAQPSVEPHNWCGEHDVRDGAEEARPVGFAARAAATTTSLPPKPKHRRA